MVKKLSGKRLTKFEAERDVWQEVIDGVREITAGGGKRTKVRAKSIAVPADVEQSEYLLKRTKTPRNQGLVKLLLSCPVKDWFQAIDRTEITGTDCGDSVLHDNDFR